MSNLCPSILMQVGQKLVLSIEKTKEDLNMSIDGGPGDLSIPSQIILILSAMADLYSEGDRPESDETDPITKDDICSYMTHVLEIMGKFEDKPIPYTVADKEGSLN